MQEKRPVEQVTWYECIAFCKRLTETVYGNSNECVYYDADDNSVYIVEDATAKKVPLFDINITKKGFRLPTEAEWQYAAMGGEDFKYAGSNNIDTVAWYNKNSKDKTHEVKKLAKNGYGLYDMSGNVLEWCFDSWQFTPVSGDNPVGSGSSKRVMRGGNWSFSSAGCTVVSRSYNGAGANFADRGLRLVCSF